MCRILARSLNLLGFITITLKRRWRRVSVFHKERIVALKVERLTLPWILS